MTQQRAGYPLDYSKGEGKPNSKQAQDVAGAATEKLGDAAAQAQELAGHVVEQARIYGEQAQEAVKNFKPYVEKSMKEKPMATLAVAALIGAALGALWKK